MSHEANKTLTFRVVFYHDCVATDLLYIGRIIVVRALGPLRARVLDTYRVSAGLKGEVPHGDDTKLRGLLLDVTHM